MTKDFYLGAIDGMQRTLDELDEVLRQATRKADQLRCRIIQWKGCLDELERLREEEE